jgi:protoporphyrinogen/coproporphyrinogen III oxidase
MSRKTREIAGAEPTGKSKVEELAVERAKNMNDTYDVIIVGGGISGLAAAYTLQDSRILVLERENRMGGRLLSGKWDMYHYNLGAQFVTGAKSNVGKFVDALGVKRTPVGNEISFYYHDHIVHGNLFNLARQTPMSLRAKFSLMRSGIDFMLKLPIAANDLDKMGLLPDNATKSIPAWIRRRAISRMDTVPFSRVLNDYHPDVKELYATMLRSLTTADVAQLSSLFSISFLLGSSDGPTLVEGGMSAITSAWEQEMAGRFLTGAEVSEVVVEDGGTKVVFERGGEQKTVRARRCIISTPAPHVLKIVKQLPDVHRAVLESVQYGTFLVVVLFLEKRVADGIWVMPIQGKLFSTLLNPTYLPTRAGTANGHGILTLYCSDENARNLWDYPDDDIISRFAAEIYTIYPELRGRVMGGVVHRWALGLPRWEPGYLYGLPTLQEPVGPIHFCGDYTNIPCLDSAVSSGLRAAKEVKESLLAGNFVMAKN